MLTFEKIQSAVFITINVSIFSTLISFFLSMIFGYLIAIYQFQLKKPIVIFLSSLTSIPPVCAGLLVYILISRSGPLGWMEILYSPIAMIIAQIVIIFPIMITLIIKNIEEDYPIYRDELISYGASKKDIIFILFSNKTNIYITVLLLGFGRAISEYGAAAIVGGSIDHFTRNMTATIALETSKGNVSLGIILGVILISLTLFPMLFQKPISLNKSLEDNFLLLSNIKKSKVNKSYFNLFNLNKLKKRKFQNLSEGEKQKVFISRFMSFEQDLIILDEPNQNLDLESEKSFFSSLSKMKNKTIVLTLHNLTYIKDFADYLVILDSGKIIFNDTIKKFTKK